MLYTSRKTCIVKMSNYENMAYIRIVEMYFYHLKFIYYYRKICITLLFWKPKLDTLRNSCFSFRMKVVPWERWEYNLQALNWFKYVTTWKVVNKP